MAGVERERFASGFGDGGTQSLDSTLALIQRCPNAASLDVSRAILPLKRFREMYGPRCCPHFTGENIT